MPYEAMTNVTSFNSINSSFGFDVAAIIILLLIGVVVGMAFYEGIYLKAKKSLKYLFNGVILTIFGFFIELVFRGLYEVLKLLGDSASAYTIDDYLGFSFKVFTSFILGLVAYWVLRRLYERVKLESEEKKQGGSR